MRRLSEYGSTRFDIRHGCVIIAMLITAASATADPPLAWALPIGGSVDDVGRSVTVDGDWNVYTTGTFRGTVDFDPGPGTAIRTDMGATDVFILKTDKLGNLIWVAQIGGWAEDEVYSIAVDMSGNVYCTGSFQVTADFDPGPGTANLTAVGGPDIFIIKLNSSGNFVWVKQIGSNVDDAGLSLAFAYNSVFITGYFSGTADFDPGPGTSNLTSAGSYDAFVMKLDSSGSLSWAKRIGATFGQAGTSIAIDTSDDHIWLTGYFSRTVDFDPGPGTFNMTALNGSVDVFVLQLRLDGTFLDAVRLGGSGEDRGLGIVVDTHSGDVYCVGNFAGTVDFDPGSGYYWLTSAGGWDGFVWKLSWSLGEYLWAKQFGGASYDEIRSLALHADGKVYATGYFQGTVDFDPGAGTASLSSAGGLDGFVVALDNSGSYVWSKRFGGSSDDEARSIVLDSGKAVITTGHFQGTADFDPGAGVANLTSAGQNDGFVLKLGGWSDADADGLPDDDEISIHGTNPNDADSDDDGQIDSLEVTDGSDPNNAASISPLPRTYPSVLNTNAVTDSGLDGSPQVTTDGAGNWVAVWTSADSLGGTIGTDDDILVSRSTNNGAAWTAPAALNTNAATDSGWDGWPQVTTDGAGNWVAVWQSYDTLGGSIGGEGDILVSRSTNNGATWTAPAALNTNAVTDSGLDGSPQVTTDGTGNWVAVWASDDTLGGSIGTDYDILVSRSTNIGATWTAPVALNTNAAANSGEDGSPQVTTDGAGNWVAVWASDDTLGGTNTFLDDDILVSRSANNGATWTVPVALDTNAVTDIKYDWYPEVTTDRAGQWIAIWQSQEGTADFDILVSRSINNGATWTAPVALNTNAATDFGEDVLPQLSTDGGGNWVAVWHSNDNLGGTIGWDYDILLSRSTDNGATWLAPVALNTNATADWGEDWRPQVTTDGAGNWVAVWESDDNLGGTIGTDADILYTRFVISVDSDGDGVTDADETNVYGTDPNDADSDDDGLNDGAEVNTYNTDPLDNDSDNDGLNDGEEVNTHTTNPLNSDTDNDGLSDGNEVDTHNTDPLNSDTDNDGVLDGEEVAMGFDPTVMNPMTQTSYGAAGLPAPLPDVSTQQFQLNVPGSLLKRLLDVNVRFDITHTWDSDLLIKLKSPQNTEIILVNRRGGSGDNFTNTILDDQAATAIATGVAPFTGTFRPEQALSAFRGQPAAGIWTLTIQDMAGDDIGTLNAWSLDITTIGPQLMSTVWVNFLSPGGGNGTQLSPVNKTVDALALVVPGGTVRFAPGLSGFAQRITQPVRLESSGGTASIGVSSAGG